MKLSGQISIDLPVGDYFTTAEHRKRLEEILAFVRSTYPHATLDVRERRERRGLSLTPVAAPRAPSGALNIYVED